MKSSAFVTLLAALYACGGTYTTGRTIEHQDDGDYLVSREKRLAPKAEEDYGAVSDPSSATDKRLAKRSLPEAEPQASLSSVDENYNDESSFIVNREIRQAPEAARYYRAPRQTPYTVSVGSLSSDFYYSDSDDSMFHPQRRKKRQALEAAGYDPATGMHASKPVSGGSLSSRTSYYSSDDPIFRLERRKKRQVSDPDSDAQSASDNDDQPTDSGSYESPETNSSDDSSSSDKSISSSEALSSDKSSSSSESIESSVTSPFPTSSGSSQYGGVTGSTYNTMKRLLTTLDEDVQNGASQVQSTMLHPVDAMSKVMSSVRNKVNGYLPNSLQKYADNVESGLTSVAKVPMTPLEAAVTPLIPTMQGLVKTSLTPIEGGYQVMRMPFQMIDTVYSRIPSMSSVSNMLGFRNGIMRMTRSAQDDTWGSLFGHAFGQLLVKGLELFECLRNDPSVDKKVCDSLFMSVDVIKNEIESISTAVAYPQVMANNGQVDWKLLLESSIRWLDDKLTQLDKANMLPQSLVGSAHMVHELSQIMKLLGYMN